MKSKLAIILPAYNEEEAIGKVLDDTISAKNHILNNTSVKHIDIIVVDDGSQDKTADIARHYTEVRLISYEKNRGYGYAIKKGFASTDADYVSFFDVDGTCNPNFLADLVNVLEDEDADLSLGSRLGIDSGMPPHRKFLNRFLSFIVNVITGSKMIDMASGMRVIRRSSLNKIYPLPNGLNFTPAMSCRAALDGSIGIAEKSMPYYERIGTSKLSVFKDGLHFLKVIFEVIVTYKPFLLFFTISCLMFFLSMIYAPALVNFYVKNRMIANYYHRLSAIIVFVLVGTHSFMLGLVLQTAADLLNNNSAKKIFFERIIETLFIKKYWILSVFLLVAGLYINLEGIKNYLLTGLFKIHWLNITVGGLLIIVSLQLASIGLVNGIMGLLREKLFFARSEKE